MLGSVEFENFRALRNATLPLQRMTLVVGPNGSGKSTALTGLQAFNQKPGPFRLRLEHGDVASTASASGEVRISLRFTEPIGGAHTVVGRWTRGAEMAITTVLANGRTIGPEAASNWLNRIRVYTLDSRALATHVQVQQGVEIGPRGDGLAAVINLLQDAEPERFEALNAEFHGWIPEFDRITWDWIADNRKELALRTAGGAKIRAAHLSSGTLFTLALLTLAHLPDPPPLIGLEEPDHGIHPRLLRDVKEAIYRLCYPENYGEARPPVQVVATTHSPYLLDLFRDHPEEIVIADKVGDEGRFICLVDTPNYEDLIEDASLGDIWYSGILGGVPTER